MSISISAAIIETIDSNLYLEAALDVDSTSDSFTEFQSLILSSRSVSGFMIFLAVLTLLIEIPTIAGRFTLRGGAGILIVLHIVVRYCIETLLLSLKDNINLKASILLN